MNNRIISILSERERERERKLYPIDLCGGIDNGSARFTRNLEPWWNEANLSRGLIDKFVVGANVKMSMSMFLRLVYGGRYVASISQPLSLFELRSSPLTLPPRQLLPSGCGFIETFSGGFEEGWKVEKYRWEDIERESKSFLKEGGDLYLQRSSYYRFRGFACMQFKS